MILRKVKKTKTVKAKYRIKNNITEPVSLFLNTAKKSRARINDNTILTPIAVRVEKTFFSGVVFCPKKNIIRAINETRVNPAVSKRMLLRVTGDGETLFTPSNIETISRL
jgi:hypothetical protein